jgi:hypothetical protein
MKRNKRESDNMLGYDSFLDIVANMVGILIILVVVLGSHSKDVTAQVQAEIDQQVAARHAVSEPQETAAKVGNDVARLEQQVAIYDRELAARQRERSVIMAVLSETKSQWEKKESELAENAKRAAELAGKRRELLTSLEQLTIASETKIAKPARVFTLEHLPTPMAQTVFGEELHFRLKQGRLAVVPLQSLVESIEQDFRRMVSSGPREGAKEGVVGPLRDFTASYQIQTSRAVVARGGSASTGIRVELVGLVIEPVREPLGEPFPEALSDNSQLAYELAGREPRTTTITVWVYPDSFVEFRRLKEHLFAKGFATAARPLPEGRPITGSPQGSRSTAQ